VKKIGLDRVALQVQEAQDSAGMAFLLSQRFHHATTDAARSELVTKAGEEARKALDASRDALESLQNEGAVLADRVGSRLRHEPNLLADLAALDTPDVRALLAGLEALLPVAERVDASRGRAGESVVGGSAGFDVAEDLAQMIARLSLEIHGPASTVTGGRE
jgi:hypothetical protein